MSEATAPGSRLLATLAAERPLQIVGTVNAFSALQAQRAGFRAIYLSGAGVANVSFGLPDLGMTGLQEVVAALVDLRRTYQAHVDVVEAGVEQPRDRDLDFHHSLAKASGTRC